MQWSLTTYMHWVTYAFHRCLLRCSLGRHNKESKEQQSNFSHFFPVCLTVTFSFNTDSSSFPYKTAGITSFLHGVHLHFALNQSQVLSQEKALLSFLKSLPEDLFTWEVPAYTEENVAYVFPLKKEEKEESSNCHINIFNPLFFTW